MTKHPSFLLLKPSRLLIERYLSQSRPARKNKWFVSMHRMCRLRSPGIEPRLDVCDWHAGKHSSMYIAEKHSVEAHVCC